MMAMDFENHDFLSPSGPNVCGMYAFSDRFSILRLFIFQWLNDICKYKFKTKGSFLYNLNCRRSLFYCNTIGFSHTVIVLPVSHSLIGD